MNTYFKTFLARLGITVVQSGSDGETIINKDGEMMVDHPITVGVEKVNCSYHSPIVEIESDGDQFIRSPFVALAKNYYEGRIVLLGHGGRLEEDFSGLRLMVNTVEWVAGYTPPGWSPSVDSSQEAPSILTYFFMVTTIILAITTAFLAVKRRKSLKL